MAEITKIINLRVEGTSELARLETEINKTSKQLKNLEKAGKKNAGMQKIQAGKVAELRTKLKGLRGERTKEQNALLASAKGGKQLSNTYGGLVARNREILTQLKKNPQAFDKNNKAVAKLKEEYIKNNNALKSFDASLGNNQRNVGNYGSGLGKLKQTFSNVAVGIGATIVVFNRLSNVVKNGIKDFAEFETGITNVLTLLDDNTVAEFGDQVKTGALDVMTEFGLEIQDVNKAMFDSISAGVSAADATDFLREAAILSTAGVTDLSVAVDGLTTIVNAYGLDQSEVNKVSAAFFTAQKFGKTTVEELSSVIGTTAPIAKQAGISYQELLTTFAELTKQGIGTNEAATAIKGSITALLKPSKDAQKEFKRLGIEFGVSALKQNGYKNTLVQIAAAVKEDEDAITKLIPNVRALTAIGALGEEQLKEYDEILNQVTNDYGENSSIAKAFGAQQETLNKQLDEARARFTRVRIEAGDKLKPAIVAVLEAFTSFLANLDKIVVVLKNTATAFVVAKTVALGYKIATQGLSTALGLAAIKQRALNIATKANPYVLAATALVTLISSIRAFNKRTLEATESQKKFKTQLKAVQDLQNQTTRIEEQVAQVDNLTQAQKENLKAKIDSQLADIEGKKLAAQALNEENTSIIRLKASLEDLQAQRQKILDNRSSPTASAESQKAYQEEKQELERLNGSIKNTSQILDGIQREEFTGTLDELTTEYDRLNEAQKIVNQSIKRTNTGTREQKETVFTLTTALALEENTLEEISNKTQILKDVRDKAKIGSEEFGKATEELTRLQELANSTTKKSVEEDEKKEKSIQDRINAEQQVLNKLKGVAGFENEVLQSQINLKQAQIDLILQQADEEGKLSAEQIANVQKLKGEITQLNNERNTAPTTQKLFGLDEEGFAAVTGSLNALGGVLAGINAQRNQEQNQLIDSINSETETKLENFEKEAEARGLTDEQIEDGRKAIEDEGRARANKVAKEQFEQNKRAQILQATIAGANSILRITADYPKFDFGISTAIAIGAQALLTAQQIKLIKSQQFKPMAKGGMLNGPSHAEGGIKYNLGGQMVELEGGEAVINKKSMSNPILRNMASQINEMGGGVSFARGGMINKFADGGMTLKGENTSILSPNDLEGIASLLNVQRVVVSESDITRTQGRISVLESRTTFN